MTLLEIQERLEQIQDLAGDPEAAHSREDDLYEDVLRYISESEIHPYAEMAQQALRTKDIVFERWCA